MNTNLKNVQILISLLKQHNIHHLVISPGTRNTPLVHSVETDDFFFCYSIVDERSAAYFALGLSEALDKPVCVTCTAATATCNYMPAIKEAYERNIQIVALTADRELYYRFHMEDQCINQVNMYNGYVKYHVDIPYVDNSEDDWYCNRCINEAFLEMNHHGKGPIQINYHVPELGEFTIPELPVTRKIDRYENNICWEKFRSLLSEERKILVVAGSYFDRSGALNTQLEMFCDKYPAVVLCDHFANIASDKFMNASALGDVLTYKEAVALAPELVITFGAIFYSPIKYHLIGKIGELEHWQIAEDGLANDGYKVLKNIFECSPIEFFTEMNQIGSRNSDKIYYNLWKNRLDQVKWSQLPFTNFKVIETFAKAIPDDSLLHLSVLDSIRLTNYMKLKPSVRCFANIGADGIDGALSTFLGQAKETEHLAFLVIGDLSYLYDMNASVNLSRKNIRILLINNYAGAEFHKNFGLKMIPTLNLHIAAGHHTKISDCEMLTGSDYLAASNMKELEDALVPFVHDNDRPIILEVFTDADTDANTLKKFWHDNKKLTEPVKTYLKKILGKRGVSAVKKLLKKR